MTDPSASAASAEQPHVMRRDRRFWIEPPGPTEGVLSAPGDEWTSAYTARKRERDAAMVNATKTILVDGGILDRYEQARCELANARIECVRWQALRVKAEAAVRAADADMRAAQEEISREVDRQFPDLAGNAIWSIYTWLRRLRALAGGRS